MRVISLNVNGLRAAARKGFFSWLQRQHADIVCLQETRIQRSECIFLPRYHCHYYIAEKKGYSGVALYTRIRPDEVVRGFGWSEANAQARYLEARFKGLSVASLYVPSGSASEARQ